MPSPRKRGAPKKNKNALKHGIYSQFITLGDDKTMKGMSDNNSKDDLAFARVSLKKAAEKRANATDTKDYLALDFACHYWLDTIINAKIRSKEIEQSIPTVWNSLIEAVRAANDRQGFHR